ncbi:MAG: tRNA (adenosine(37)-N6)-threonylcarbamoyltransferase complex dimerization subunit type 1 TsaB [Chloroflexi bacterium]|nr:tRNA (adenosine(37)-N6)-threonylcarbamoyltransferase complex dimerization subunit type 1 TsaB [Chloroflexota bacterium]
MELAIDTSTFFASVALAREGVVTAELTWRCGQNHTVELLPAIDLVLGQVKEPKSSIMGVIVARGPGSFNGLRVGIATAKGLGYALGIPVVGMSTLEVEAFPHLETGLPVCAVHNAGRGEVAAALFREVSGQRLRVWEEQILSPRDLVNRIDEKTVFCGEIPADLAAMLKDVLGPLAAVVVGASALRRAGFLAELGWSRLHRGDHDDLAALQPLYLRRPPITIPKSKTGVTG